MTEMRSFLVVDPAGDREVPLRWPWLNLVPTSWRRAASSWASPKCLPALATADGCITGHALTTVAGWPTPKTANAIINAQKRISTGICGWAGSSPPLEISGIFWRRGRIAALLAALGAFRDEGTGDPAGMTVMVHGEARAELAVAARYLARVVRRLILVSPREDFRRRLAAQILGETGLVVMTREAPPAGGWDVALDLGGSVPRLVLGDCLARPRIVFPQPLLRVTQGKWLGRTDHPVWDECYLACLAPNGADLPFETSLAALRAAFALAERAEIKFTLA